ncbi:MAG: tetratricopeptide repeat protein [Pseudolabrys sp.]
MTDAAKTLGKAQALHQRGDLSEARKLYSRILRQEKSNTMALFLLTTLAAQDGDYNAALELIDRALKRVPAATNSSSAKNEPSFADIVSLKGRILNALALPADALVCYEAALQNDPDHAASLLNSGVTLLLLNRSQEALTALNKLGAAMPREPLVHHNRAIALTDLQQYEQAIASADQAIKLSPNYAEALQARGIAYGYMQRHDLALKDFKAAFKLNPKLDYLIGNLVNSQLWSSDWDGLSQNQQEVISGLSAVRRVVTPFSFISMSSLPAEQLACAKIYAAAKSAISKENLWDDVRYAHEKIRVAYLSADFREHATSYLMAGVFEHHDRKRFETTAISFGPDTPSDMLTRLKTSFARFINVRGQSDIEVAKLLKALEIDIVVDLMGYTGGGRPEILAHRSAPIQVNYLAYPGTMAADYMDYLIADPTLIPEPQRQYYTEKIVYLPNSYAPTDAKRVISDMPFQRSEMGLPQTGFVFCCFNNNYKLNPDLFTRWMDILKKVEGSVLWLSENNSTAAVNLKKEANARGVNADRIIFAKRVPLIADHLARFRLADLFLDTSPNNAHTTANDALWAGLPVLTQIGETFAGRVAASLLTAIGLPELITSTPKSYEALAVDLATNRDKLTAIRQKLAANRLTMPLFDTALYTRHVEAAYIAMHERRQAGLQPDTIFVSK